MAIAVTKLMRFLGIMHDPQTQGKSDLLPPGGLFLSQQTCLLQVLCQMFSFLPFRLPSTYNMGSTTMIDKLQVVSGRPLYADPSSKAKPACDRESVLP